MQRKPFWESKELWVVALGLLNLLLDKFGYPSFDPTPEFYAAILTLLGILRAFFTKATLTAPKPEILQ
jgi:hypothetical protein